MLIIMSIFWPSYNCSIILGTVITDKYLNDNKLGTAQNIILAMIHVQRVQTKCLRNFIFNQRSMLMNYNHELILKYSKKYRQDI